MLDFNFWPSFADLMLTLVLIIIIILFLLSTFLSSGDDKIKYIGQKQDKITSSIAKVYNSQAKKISDDTFGISINNSNAYDIIIKNEPTIQHITFSNHILFAPDEHLLNPSGKEVLANVGKALGQEIDSIQEIQIQGNADTDKTYKYESNLVLAAMRAIQVFEFFKNENGINPSEHLMSITSFGEYNPSSRSKDDFSYNDTKLSQANDTEEKKLSNRRIELLLFYKN